MPKNEQMDNNKQKKKTVYKIGFVIFTIAFLILAGIMIRNHFVEQEAQEQYENLAHSDKPNQQSPSTEQIQSDVLEELGITIPEKELDWEALWETNEHIYGWITIPNTVVDYPILQHPQDDTYYLEYNMDGTKGRPGCIYSEHYYNGTDFTDFNTVLYGHNMSNGTMFHDLHLFEDRAFFEENRYMYIYTPEHVYVFDIFAAYVFDSRHLLYHFDNNNESDRAAYLEEVFAIRDMSAHFREDVEVTTDSNILTLSTCVKGDYSKRYLVQGVLVNPVE